MNFKKIFQYLHKNEQQIFASDNSINLSLLKCISDINAVCNDVTRQHKKKKILRWIMEEKGMKKRKIHLHS